MYQKRVHGCDFDFGWLEDRLLPLGFRLVLCVRKPETFEAALGERLKVSGKPSQYRGVTDLIEEQDMIRELVATSRIPFIEVDVTGGHVDAITGRIADWLEATGGLWLDGDRVKLSARAG
jgi:hypothetical protein